MDHNEPELSIMESIYRAAHGPERLTQRELARCSGLSLGMINSLLRSLVERGWVKLEKRSSRSVLYGLTPQGLAEVTRRTAGYLRRASQGVGLYREKLEKYVISAKQAGIETVVLSGESALDFLLEYLCERHGLVFVKSADPERARSLGRRPHVALLLSEQGDSAESGDDGVSRLAELLAAEEAREKESPPAQGQA